MKIVNLGAIATVSLIALGVVLILPPYTRNTTTTNKVTPVMLSFTILDADDGSDGQSGANQRISGWCADLAKVLAKYDVKAAVFVSGKVADANPPCVTSFPYSSVDIGSETYSYADLASISDYTKALEEVKAGKQTIDKVGDLDSKLFRAPYGSVNETNIYSLLSRSGILADFSYADQYNKYEQDHFVKYNLISLQGKKETSSMDELSSSLSSSSDNAVVPVIINFDNSMPIENIEDYISSLKSNYGDKIRFANASELTGISLTVRREAP